MEDFHFTLLCIPIYIVKKETQKFEDKGTGGPGTFKKSPGTFGLLWSRDHGTTGLSRSLGPVPSRDRPGTVPGRPGTEQSCWKA